MYQPLVQSFREVHFLVVFIGPIIVHPSSMHYNMSVIIAISLQERLLYITTQKMNGSELLLFMIM